MNTSYKKHSVRTVLECKCLSQKIQMPKELSKNSGEQEKNFAVSIEQMVWHPSSIVVEVLWASLSPFVNYNRYVTCCPEELEQCSRRSSSESTCSNSQSLGPKKRGCGGWWCSVLIQTLAPAKHCALQQTFWNLDYDCFFCKFKENAPNCMAAWS